ncbi:hypothetical protein GCM10010317_009840 [Streptomyces mirabilis]|nr:hypothetical protein GCM10010317_009840 [Streptomyces mirabilis]
MAGRAVPRAPTGSGLRPGSPARPIRLAAGRWGLVAQFPAPLKALGRPAFQAEARDRTPPTPARIFSPPDD